MSLFANISFYEFFCQIFFQRYLKTSDYLSGNNTESHCSSNMFIHKGGHAI